jgi:hypothetical protein
MSFTEEVKLEAKRRAHYCCVWCGRREYFIEVHHIVPEAEGGESTLDNAAPLCSICHTNFGHSASHRKQMRERRDWWWDHCAQQVFQVLPQLEQIQNTAEALKTRMDAQDQRSEARFAELKEVVLDSYHRQVEKVSTARTVSELMATSSNISAVESEFIEGLSSMPCPKCGSNDVGWLSKVVAPGEPSRRCRNCLHEF